jgi:alanine racemase
MEKLISQKNYSWVEISLSAIAHNYRVTRSLISKKTKVMAVVKADAYGHGLIPVSKVLARQGIDYLAVASVNEAESLRASGIAQPILLLNVCLKNQLDSLFRYNITASVSAIEQARILNAKAKSLRKTLKIHLEIDTGMGRFGFWYKDAPKQVKEIFNLPNLDCEGIYSHFPCADTDINFSRSQINNFKNLLAILKTQGISFKLVHMANSAGVINCSDSEFNLVRPGLMLYGLTWDKRITLKLALKPAMSFMTRIVFLKDVGVGRPISYGRTYVASKPKRIATLAVGYADGYNRMFSNKASVLIKGKSAKITGRVCMDHCMADVTNINNLRIGDEVVLFGKLGKEQIFVEDLSLISRTIPYEIVCLAGSRYNRIWL